MTNRFLTLFVFTVLLSDSIIGDGKPAVDRTKYGGMITGIRKSSGSTTITFTEVWDNDLPMHPYRPKPVRFANRPSDCSFELFIVSIRNPFEWLDQKFNEKQVKEPIRFNRCGTDFRIGNYLRSLCSSVPSVIIGYYNVSAQKEKDNRRYKISFFRGESLTQHVKRARELLPKLELRTYGKYKAVFYNSESDNILKERIHDIKFKDARPQEILDFMHIQLKQRGIQLGGKPEIRGGHPPRMVKVNIDRQNSSVVEILNEIAIKSNKLWIYSGTAERAILLFHDRNGARPAFTREFNGSLGEAIR